MISFNDKLKTEVVKRWETKYALINNVWFDLARRLLLFSVGV